MLVDWYLERLSALDLKADKRLGIDRGSKHEIGNHENTIFVISESIVWNVCHRRFIAAAGEYIKDGPCPLTLADISFTRK
jgi:hypothetical protein